MEIILTFVFLMFLGWPVAILLAVLLHKSRKRLRAVERPEGRERARYWERSEAPRSSLSEALDLATVRLDLDRRHAVGLLPTERHAELCAGIEGLWMEQLRAVGVGPGREEWCRRRARAFDLLSARGLVRGGPPWAEGGQARISHHEPAAADPRGPAGAISPSSPLDVVSATPSPAPGPRGPEGRHLGRSGADRGLTSPQTASPLRLREGSPVSAARQGREPALGRPWLRRVSVWRRSGKAGLG